MAACTPFPIFDSSHDEVNISKHKKGCKTTTTKLILMKQHKIGADFRGKPRFRSNRLTCKQGLRYVKIVDLSYFSL